MGARAETIRERAERKKHLSVVERRLGNRDKSRKRHTKGFVITVSALLAGAIVMGVLLEQVLLAQSAFELAELRKNVAAAEARHEELLLQSANLDSAARIERYARTNLGMIEPPPGAVEYVVADVRTGTTLGRATVEQGNEPPSVAGGLRAAASYGGSP